MQRSTYKIKTFTSSFDPSAPNPQSRTFTQILVQVAFEKAPEMAMKWRHATSPRSYNHKEDCRRNSRRTILGPSLTILGWKLLLPAKKLLRMVFDNICK